jgi:hypothetical protein
MHEERVPSRVAQTRYCIFFGALRSVLLASACEPYPRRTLMCRTVLVPPNFDLSSRRPQSLRLAALPSPHSDVEVGMGATCRPESLISGHLVSPGQTSHEDAALE